MKKFLILIFFFITVSAFSQIQTINVGTAPNTGTGDPLRTAFIKVNNNFSYHSGLIALKANLASPTFTGLVKLNTDTLGTKAYSREVLADAVTAAIPLGNLSPQWSDTILYIGTKKDIENFEGGGSGAKIYKLQFIVGVTSGAPLNNATTFTHTSYIGKHVEVFRGAPGAVHKLYYADPASNGFSFNNSTGTITFNPALATNEMVVIESTNTITWENLSIEGEESVLNDSLLAVYEMDEVLGTAVTDAYGTNHGTTDAVNDANGKIGRSKIFGGTSYITIPNHSSLLPNGDELSISMWFYLTTLPSTAGHYMYLTVLRDATYHAATILMHTTNYIAFYLRNSAGTAYEFETAASAVSTGQWYHLVCVNEGAGEMAKIYLNNVDITSYRSGAFTGVLRQFDSSIIIGNVQPGYTLGVMGYMDQTLFSKQAFTPADVSWLWNGGNGRAYPFN